MKRLEDDNGLMKSSTQPIYPDGICCEPLRESAVNIDTYSHFCADPYHSSETIKTTVPELEESAGSSCEASCKYFTQS